jgi:hypothetical protein
MYCLFSVFVSAATYNFNSDPNMPRLISAGIPKAYKVMKAQAIGGTMALVSVKSPVQEGDRVAVYRECQVPNSNVR